MSRSALLGRVGPTFVANIFNQIVVVLVQLALVPILLSNWGAERYGVWLLLSAIPTYLTLSDFGFTFIAKNEMTIKVVQGDRAGALTVFQSVLILLCLIAAMVLGGIFGVAGWVDLGKLFALGNVPVEMARNVLLLLVGNVVLTQFFLLQCAGVRCIGRPASEVMWGGLARLSEGAVVGISAWSSEGLDGAALAVLVSRICFCLALVIWLRRAAPWLSWGIASATRVEIARLFHPSFSYMFISLANALMIQGPVVILGAIAQPETVVIFSTSRTLARLGTSAANLINFSFSPEYSRLFGKGEGAAFRSLLKIHATIGAIGITGYVLILGVAGNVILTYWTHGKVPALYPFFAILNAAVAAEMTWGAIFTPLAAINLHTRVSYCFAVISILAIAISAAVAPSAGIVGVMLPVLATHSLMIFVAGWEFRRRLRMVCVSGDIRA